MTFVDREPSGPHETPPPGLPPTTAERETRIPPWAVTAVSVAVATAALIGWGEVRFIRHDVYQLEQTHQDERVHLLEERIQKAEDNATDDRRESRKLHDDVIEMKGELRAIADKLGVKR